MDIWGIDGPAFLGIYLSLLAVTTGAALLIRPRPQEAPSGEELDEYEVAYVSGGARLVAVTALVNLQERGAVDLGDSLLRQLHASGDIDLARVRHAGQLSELGVELHANVVDDAVAAAAAVHPVESAALQAVRGTVPPTPWRVVEGITDSRAVRRVGDSLSARGLPAGPSDGSRLRARWRWFLPLAALGAARAGAEAAAGEAVALTVAALVVTGAVMVAVGRRPVNGGTGQAARVPVHDPVLALALATPPPARAPARPARRSSRRWAGEQWLGGWSGGAGCGGGGGSDGGSCGGGHGCGGGGGGGCGGGGGGGGCGGGG